MVNMKNYEEYMLLYADRELSKEDEQALLAFIQQHPELQAELDAYAATILQPDTSIVFADKEALIKKAGGGRNIWLGNWKVYAAAAGVLLFIVVFALNRFGGKQVEPPTAEQETITEPVNNPAPEQPVVEEEPVNTVHSTKPVNTVAVNKKKVQQKPQPEQEQPGAEEPVHAPVAEITKAEPAVENKNPMRVHSIKDSTMKIARAEEPVKEEIPTPGKEPVRETHTKKKNSFLANIIGEKPAGITGLETAINEKIVIAKNVKEQLKNTEVNFRIGKKDLFTVRL